jgi:hypothetical protein
MSAHKHLRSALESIDEISRLRDVKQIEKVLQKSLENLGFMRSFCSDSRCRFETHSPNISPIDARGLEGGCDNDSVARTRPVNLSR